MSATPNIPDEVFDKTHVFVKKDGSVICPPVPSPSERHSSAVVGQGVRRFDSNNLAVVNSVYQAEGIHHHIDEEALENMPRRFEGTSVKASVTWFGAMCIAGIGMFVEAYIIITTGQIKTVWHDQLPTCFVPTGNQLCPENIECCNLFPNTPFDETTGQCAIDTSNSPVCQANGMYDEKLLCEEGIINSISYSEFAGIMLGMLIFGTLIDVLGRNATGLITSMFMIVGITVMTFVSSTNYNTLFLIWAIFFGIFGLGVGGEYPLGAANAAATDAMAKEETKLDDEERRKFRILRDHEKTARRGETIGIVFAMQGLGAVCGSVFVLILLYFSEQTHAEW